MILQEQTSKRNKLGIRIIVMTIAVILMGFCVSWLWLIEFGTDPFTFMNTQISRKLGMSFGTYQLCVNLVLFLIIVLFERTQIGLGTLGNMILVGYSADVFTLIWKNGLNISEITNFGIRVLILVPIIILFLISAAVYMNSGLGASPYDAVAFCIHNHIVKINKFKKVKFKWVRFCCDLITFSIGLAAGGKPGIVTILIVLFMGYAVEYIGSFMKRI